MDFIDELLWSLGTRAAFRRLDPLESVSEKERQLEACCCSHGVGQISSSRRGLYGGLL